MAHYILSAYDAFTADTGVAEFTQGLIDAQQYIYFCELDHPDTAVRASVAGMLGDGPLHRDNTPVRAFWIIDVATRTEAEALALRGSAACDQPLELRPVA